MGNYETVTVSSKLASTFSGSWVFCKPVWFKVPSSLTMKDSFSMLS